MMIWNTNPAASDLAHVASFQEIEARLLACTMGSWRILRSERAILSDHAPLCDDRKTRRVDSIIAEFSGDSLGWKVAECIAEYHNAWPFLVDAFETPKELNRFWSIAQKCRRLTKSLRRAPLQVIEDRAPSELSSVVGPWVLIYDGDDEQKRANSTFFRHALDDAVYLIDAREDELTSYVDTSDGRERLAIYRADVPLVDGRQWWREETTGRVWDGQQYLDQLFAPHNELTHSVVHVNGMPFDFRRHNLRLKDRSVERKCRLKPEIWALIDRLGKTGDQILAERVGVRF